MKPLRCIARRLARTRFVQRAVEDQADLSAFREKPSARLVVGLLLIGLSFVAGWPVVTLCGIIALYTGRPLVLLIGGPAAYAASWLIWGAGMLLAGAENIRYGGILFRFVVRRFVEKHAGAEPRSARDPER
jgi:hypothetical protein